MVTSLIKHERIETTITRAKELRRWADRAVTWGKKGGLSERRRALGFVREKDAVDKLFSTLAERYRHREGGYTRVVRTRIRSADAAPLAFIEFVDREGELRPARPPQGVEPQGVEPQAADEDARQ